jgi:hypothetical protein
MENQKPSAEAAPKKRGTPYNKMSGRQKTLFVCKLVVCILTFGMAFPNVMAE